jgi:hypothetical protein
VAKWVEEFEIEHPVVRYGQNYMNDGTYHMGPIAWIAAESNYTARSVNRIVNLEWVGLSMADRILTAIGQSYKLVNGEIKVVPNPTWTTQEWIETMRERGCY